MAGALRATPSQAQTSSRAHPPLTPSDIRDIARLEMLEDRRQFDADDLSRLLNAAHPEVRRRAALAIGRIADPRGVALLRARPLDPDTSIAATVVFAVGQLHDSLMVGWLDSLLSAPHTPPTVATEAAAALGKLKSTGARIVLARYLSQARATSRTVTTIGEALLAIGRCPRGNLAPITRWIGSPDEELRWRATWALFRPRDPAAVSSLLILAADRSALVRSWAVRGLTKTQADSVALGGAAEARALAATRDTDRRVRTEALRAIATYGDSTAGAVLTTAARSTDSWITVVANEGLARLHVATTPAPLPVLRDTTRVTPAPVAPRPTGPTRRTRGIAAAQQRDSMDYLRIVERWVVPAYNGARPPTARWETTRGPIELELYPGDAPLATEDFVKLMESGAIGGTEFTRVVPDFVDQQRGIRDTVVLRDEVNRHRLTRGNLAWATAGLDTGTPGYTLNHTPQPHNEGDFTSLGRVTKGMDVVDRIELGDRVLSGKMTSRVP